MAVVHPMTAVRTGAVIVASLALTAALGACGDDDDAQDATGGDGTTTSVDGDDGLDVEMVDDELEVSLVNDELEMPTSMAFIEDSVLVTEKGTGKVRVVRDGEVVGDAVDLAVNSFDERGLLGIAVHPDFPNEPYVYLHWTWRGDGDGAESLFGEDSDEATEVPMLGNRVDRFRWADDVLEFDRNIVEFPSNTLDTDTSGNVRGNHDAGPLAFGPDGMLYTMMGDQNLRGQMQNVADGPEPDDEHLAGVILRLADDGSVPEDNPFFTAGAEVGGEVGENIQMIFAYGVRNSFGMAFEPESGSLWQTENGDDSWDEINVFDAGANSGWIQSQGAPERHEQYLEIERDSDDGLDVESHPPAELPDDIEAAEAAMFTLPGATFTPPVLSYVYPPALAAIGFVGDDSLGASSERTVWVGAVLNDSLLRYPLGADGRSLALEGDLADGVDDNEAKGDLGESEALVVGTGFGTVTDLEQGSDGDLYVLSIDNGSIYRITGR